MNDMGTLRLTTHLNGDMVAGRGLGRRPRDRPRHPLPHLRAVLHHQGPRPRSWLGLDTVQRIVTKHSGFVTVDSKPGATCFQVRLPLDRAQAY